MDSDDGRLWLATLPALAAGASGVLVGREAAAEFPSADWRVMFYGTLGVTQVVMYVVYLWLTLRRFHGLDARTLERDLRTVSRGPRPGSWAVRMGLSYGSTLGWMTSVSVVALVIVVVVMLDPATAGQPLLRVLCALVVVSSWAVLWVSQALAYARMAAQHGGIEFTGEEPPVFEDYLTLSAFVSALFGTGDATLTGRRTRRAMRSHVMVAFGFNSMLVASLATLLLARG